MANDTQEHLSAEFVIGTLDEQRRKKALELLKHNPEFAAEVDAWQSYLSPLSEVLPPVEAPDYLLQNIERQLDSQEQKEAAFLSHPETNIADRLAELQNRLAGWRLAALSFGTVAAALMITVFVLLNNFYAGSVDKKYIAVLRDDNGQDGFVVTLDRRKKRFIVTSLDMRPPPSKSYELWIMHGEEKQPATLGLVATSPKVKLSAPDIIHSLKKPGGLKLAVSLEPEGGAPKGQSMGKIMFAGKFIQQPL